MEKFYPTPKHLTQVRIGPLLPPTAGNRLACIADTGNFKLTHIRADGLHGPHDALDVIKPLESHCPSRIERAAIYGGPYLNHFGHMAAEGIHRLWCRKVFPDLQDLPVIFQIAEGENPAVEDWFRSMLSLCGVPDSQLIFVNCLTHVDQLIVPQQGRVLGGEQLIQDYTKLFPLSPIHIPPHAKNNLYISRSRQFIKGTYLGEKLVESVLSQNGFEVVYPEMSEVRHVVEKLTAAELVVFSEGSGIHNLEFCGHISAKIFVIGRRFGTKRRFARLLDSVTSQWHIVPAVSNDATVHWDDNSGNPSSRQVYGIHDIQEIIRELNNFAGLNIPVVSPAETHAAQVNDILRIIFDPSAIEDISDIKLGKAVRFMSKSSIIQNIIIKR